MGMSEIIDIPESGAVFTLGKSYLSENHQSYFFIKNDVIRRLICGHNQSAVVCESGRLFVWGENQCGQLGIGGGSDIVTKPSCVKTIKALGERVRNLAFGGAFAVILTETSRVYFSGRSVFDINDDDGGNEQLHAHFTPLTTTSPNIEAHNNNNNKNGIAVCRRPIELTAFVGVLQDAHGDANGDQFVDVAAGDEHFVLLTGAGRLYGWGSNAQSQLGGVGGCQKPQLLSADERVRVFSCGRHCTAFISASNAVYIVGTIGGLQLANPVRINTGSLADLMYSIYMSHDEDRVYLVISSGEIFNSVVRDGQLQLEPHNVISENIRKVCTGAGFVAIVTESNRLLTTFREKTSASSVNHSGRLRSPRELRKFATLMVVDAVCGQHHILVHGMLASSMAGANAMLSSSSNDEEPTAVDAAASEMSMNDINRTYTKSKSTEEAGGGSGVDSLIQTLKRCLTMKDSRNVLASRIPVYDSHRRRPSQETNPSSATASDSRATSLDVLDRVETEPIEPAPTSQTVVVAVDTNVSSIGSSAADRDGSIAVDDLNNNAHMSNGHNLKKLIQSSTADERLEMDMQNALLCIDEELQPLDDTHSPVESMEITYIDNGIEVEERQNQHDRNTKPDGIIPDETSNSMAILSMPEISDRYESSLLGEKLCESSANDASGTSTMNAVNIKTETMIAVRQAVGDDSENNIDSAITTTTKSKPTSDRGDDDDSERTTASIKSEPSAKHRLDDDDGVDDNTDINAVGVNPMRGDSPGKELVAVENGRMKRFIRDVRTKGRRMSCRNVDNVVVSEKNDVALRTSHEQLSCVADDVRTEAIPDEKTSKVCVIL